MKNKGFTIIELLVTIAAFLLIFGAVIGIFIAGLQQQRISLAKQALVDQTSFALEFISRALRMASKEFTAGGNCLSSYGKNYEPTHGDSGIKFINILESGDCQEFFLENGQLMYRKKIISNPPGETFPLTSDKIQINFLKFNLIGEGQEDKIQPRVTLFLEVEGQVSGVPKLKIQTSISQRNLDVEY